MSILDVAPGRYILKLATGRTIWRGELRAEDLIWTSAFPERRLQLAADTDAASPEPSREEPVLGGEFLLRVFPGVERGAIEIHWKGAKS